MIVMSIHKLSTHGQMMSNNLLVSPNTSLEVIFSTLRDPFLHDQHVSAWLWISTCDIRSWVCWQELRFFF